MNHFQGADVQSTRDWPSERFELLWLEVAAAAPPGPFTREQIAALPVILNPVWGKIPTGAWVLVTGKLEQRTPMGAVHSDGEEWFVRNGAGDPIAVYAMSLGNVAPTLGNVAPTLGNVAPTLGTVPVGTVVEILGRDAGTIRLADRQGILRDYHAVIGRPIEHSAARELHSTVREAESGFPVGFIAIFAVIVLIGAWFFVRVIAKRSARVGASRIRAVADRAREDTVHLVSNAASKKEEA